MKRINDLVDLGTEIDLNDDVMVILTRDNCPNCQILFIRLQTMEAEGEAETPIVEHNMNKSGSFEDSAAIYDVNGDEIEFPVAVRFHKGKEYGRASGLNLSPEKFKELDLMEEPKSEE